MPAISPISPTNTAANVVAYGNATIRQPKQVLGQDDFMKLLAVQFQSQDPMKPMEDTAFIAQMAQFSSLEQSSSLVTEMGLLRADQQNIAAASFLGRVVTVDGADGLPVTGTVSAMQKTASGPALVIDGTMYSLTSVRRVELPAANPTTLSTTPGELPPAA